MTTSHRNPSPLRIERAETATEAVVVLYGELDLGSASQLSDTLEELVERGWSRIVIDFSGVTFVNSTGLGVMVAITKRLRDSGGDLIVRSFCGIPAAALAVTDLDDFLTIES